jgi:hypothetical protein
MIGFPSDVGEMLYCLDMCLPQGSCVHILAKTTLKVGIYFFIFLRSSVKLRASTRQSTYQPFYLSSETVLPVKPFDLSNATCTAT